MALFDLGVLTDLTPIGGGWRYPQSFQGSIVTLRSGDAPKGSYQSEGDKLVAAVRAFRVRYGVPVGDPEKDVRDFILQASPRNDRFRGRHQPQVNRPAESVNLPQRLREWISAMAPLKPKLIAQYEAVERGNACKDCPHNIKWRSGSKDVDAMVEFEGYCLRAQTEFPLDYALKACELHGLHLQSAVFIDRDFLPPRSPDAPEACWLPMPPQDASLSRPTEKDRA